MSQENVEVARPATGGFRDRAEALEAAGLSEVVLWTGERLAPARRGALIRCRGRRPILDHLAERT
jgi:hypothetical protein